MKIILFKCIVPQGDEVQTETTPVKLGVWLMTQRMNHKKGTLRPERLELLEKLVRAKRLRWANTRSSDLWMSSYNLLLQYGEEHGHCNGKYQNGRH